MKMPNPPKTVEEFQTRLVEITETSPKRLRQCADYVARNSDIIAVSTRPRVVTLREVMSMEPRGFTNIQESIALARSLFDTSRSERHLLFLITDGLPEAATADGNPLGYERFEHILESLDEPVSRPMPA